MTTMMKMKNNIIDLLDEKFESVKASRTFIRFNEKHPIDIFVGYDEDGRASLIVKEKSCIRNIRSTKYIEATITKNANNDMYLNFTLLDNSMYSIFLRFCEDLITSSKEIIKNKVIQFMINRWYNWINIFKNRRSELLSTKEITGLIGELLFLEKLMKQIDIKDAIDSWNGPSKSSKDFECMETWYEIKTRSRVSQEIIINSIDQLDSPIKGYLVVNSIEQTSSINKLGINLNKLVNRILDEIQNYEDRMKFIDKLSKAGYIEQEEYDEFNYKILKTDIYSVEEDFPRMREIDLSEGIVGVSYKIIIEMIKQFLYKGRELEWISRNIN